MSYKIGDRVNVVVPGFSPTMARIDNITQRNEQTFYHISFQEEYLYTICRTVSERELERMIEMYETNKDNPDFFMRKRNFGDFQGSSKNGNSQKEAEISYKADINLTSGGDTIKIL